MRSLVLTEELRALRKEVRALSSGIPSKEAHGNVLRLPLSSLEDMDFLKKQLQDHTLYEQLVSLHLKSELVFQMNYLSTVGGENFKATIANRCSSIVTLGLMKEITWRPKKGLTCIMHMRWVRAVIGMSFLPIYPTSTDSVINLNITGVKQTTLLKEVKNWTKNRKKAYRRLTLK